MTWTKKHDEYSLKFQLRPSTQLLYRWINRRSKNYTVSEIEIDLRDFNKWVEKKRGRPYARKTLKMAMNQLIEETEGLVVCMKQVAWYYFKIIVRPLAYLEREKSPKSKESPKPKDRKPPLDGEFKKRGYKQQQQNIDLISKLFNQIDIKFDNNALIRIWRLSGKSIERVMEVIELLLYRNSSKKVEIPHGFIMDALKYGWQKGFNLYYEPELPKFNSVKELINYTSKLRKSLRIDFSPSF